MSTAWKTPSLAETLSERISNAEPMAEGCECANCANGMGECQNTAPQAPVAAQDSAREVATNPPTNGGKVLVQADDVMDWEMGEL